MIVLERTLVGIDEVGRRPLPPRCRGTLLENGEYSCCPYGSGELRVLTGPCDCSVCHGSGYEGMIATWIPHQDFGDPECCGFLYGVVRSDKGYIECNDCDGVIRTLPSTDLRQALDEMESGWSLPLKNALIAAT